MKTRLTLLFSLLALAAFGQGSLTTVTLAWDPVPGLANDSTAAYVLYHSPDAGTWPAGWSVVTNVPATRTSVDIRVLPGVHFYTLTASNFWGESTNSNVVSTPVTPDKPKGLKVFRTP